MLLETFESKKDDVIIFSENRFDFDNNFKIIIKNETFKKPRNLSYFEVCDFIKDIGYKNLIVYRLLTNDNNLDSYSSKYGFFINHSGNLELFYFDPAFVLKDLKYLKYNLEPEKFRFKIQQVGLTCQIQTGVEAIYREVFSFNLRAVEAQNQNDRIFVDAIYAFDETYNSENEIISKTSNYPKERLTILSLEDITEEKQTNDNLKIDKLENKFANHSVYEKKMTELKNEMGQNEVVLQQKKRPFAEFIEKNRINPSDINTPEKGNKLDFNSMEKSVNTFNQFNENYVLKINSENKEKEKI